METVTYRHTQSNFFLYIKEFFRFLPEVLMISVSVFLVLVGYLSIFLVIGVLIVGVLSSLAKMIKWWRW